MGYFVNTVCVALVMKTCHFYLYHNFLKYRQIFIFFTVSFSSELQRKLELNRLSHLKFDTALRSTLQNLSVQL